MIERNKAKVQALFPDAYVLYEDIDVDHDKILDDVKKLNFKELKDQPTYMTKSIKIFKDFKSLKKLKNLLEKITTDCVRNIIGYDVDVSLINMWATKTAPKCGSGMHNHRNFWYTCVYYPHGSIEDNFAIEFSTYKYQNCMSVPVSNNTQFNSSAWTHVVKRGNLLIFPANILHQILMNNSKNFRYSIAATFLPKGEIGEHDGKIQFNIKE